uniref:Rho-GAP domain-containing protein n=1 Tax=Tetradesmus obliquus TaxID=3088 RepID=A0A383VSK7_TETOB
MKQLQGLQNALQKAANLVGKQLVDTPQAHAVPSPGQQHQRSGWPRPDDPVLEHLLRDFRSAKLRRQFFSHDPKEYSETLDVKVLAGTYNVAGKRPPTGLKLHEWLHQWKDCWPQAAAAPAAAGSAAGAGPDIVAIGFQEVVPLSAGNVIAGPSSAGADAWDYVLASTLNGDEWAGRNFGRTFGSNMASQAMYLNLERLGAQAYNVLSTQAANVVGSMEKMWTGAGTEGAGAAGNGGAASAAQQQARLEQALASSEFGEDEYVQVVSKQLVGVYLTVWARKRTARHVRGVQTTSAATGFGGYLGNKGAVAARLRVHDAGLLLVASHLASGDAEGDELRRNADVADILRRCTFSADQQPGQSLNGSTSSNGHWGSSSSILEHDNVVWLGDLNYRLTCSSDEARRLLRADKLEALLSYDQLTREMEAGHVFQGWREGPISFSPTYKYHLGCNVYSGEPLPPGVAMVRAVDSSNSLADSASDTAEDSATAGRDSPSVEKQKKRTPAWCDRVLWLPGRQLYQLAYGRGEIAVSDHRPVAAAFLLEAHRYNRDTVQQLAEAARRNIDMSDNAARPRCLLHPNFIELQLLPFGVAASHTVSLSNEGATPARFYFVAPPKPRMSVDGQMCWDDNQPISPPWLAISPDQGEVAPGEAVSITLTAFVSGGGPASAAAHIAANPPPPPAPINTLDTILILRLEDGADSFISCHGSLLPSCFGMDLDALLTLGDSPVLSETELQQGQGKGRQLLQQGLQRVAAAAAAGQEGEGEGDLLGLQQLELGDAAAAAAAGSGGAAGAGAGAGDSKLVTGLEERVPKEVQRLVSFLQVHLHTPGLFVHSHSACCSSLQPRHAPHTKQQLQQLLAATAPIRWALDAGVDFPQHATPHQAAAALLLMLQQLPDSLMPPDVAAVLVHCVPPVPAAMLSDAMSVTEWATLRHLLALWRRALAPEVAERNGLSAFSLAGVLAEHVFGDTAAAVPPEVAANRVAFMMALLDPQAAAPATMQQQQQRQQQLAAAPAGQPQQLPWGVPAPSAPVHQRGTSAVAQSAAQQPSESLI